MIQRKAQVVDLDRNSRTTALFCNLAPGRTPNTLVLIVFELGRKFHQRLEWFRESFPMAACRVIVWSPLAVFAPRLLMKSCNICRDTRKLLRKADIIALLLAPVVSVLLRLFECRFVVVSGVRW